MRPLGLAEPAGARQGRAGRVVAPASRRAGLRHLARRPWMNVEIVLTAPRPHVASWLWKIPLFFFYSPVANCSCNSIGYGVVIVAPVYGVPFAEAPQG